MKWTEQSRKLSSTIKVAVADNSLTNQHARDLLKYSHSTQNKLAAVILKKGISSDKNVLRPFLKSFDADPSADLDKLADNALGIETVTVPVDKIPVEVLTKINDEKEQFAKVQRIKNPRKKPSKPITKEQFKEKMAKDNNKKLANSAFKFEKVKVIQGVKGREPPLKRQIKPLIVPIPNTPDFSLCQCALCSLFGKHCKGRSET